MAMLSSWRIIEYIAVISHISQRGAKVQKSAKGSGDANAILSQLQHGCTENNP